MHDLNNSKSQDCYFEFLKNVMLFSKKNVKVLFIHKSKKQLTAVFLVKTVAVFKTQKTAVNCFSKTAVANPVQGISFITGKETAAI